MSKIQVDTIEDRLAGESVDTAYVVHGTAKVWVHINGNGTTASIHDSMNVSSIIDGGTGSYTTNFTNPMNNIVYNATSTGGEKAGAGSFSGIRIPSISELTVSSFRVLCRTYTNARLDTASVHKIVMGTLA